jgi:hypothetical protein
VVTLLNKVIKFALDLYKFFLAGAFLLIVFILNRLERGVSMIKTKKALEVLALMTVDIFGFLSILTVNDACEPYYNMCSTPSFLPFYCIVPVNIILFVLILGLNLAYVSGGKEVKRDVKRT